MEPITINNNGFCNCDCGTECPLGKWGMEPLCTEKELRDANIPIVKEPKTNN